MVIDAMLAIGDVESASATLAGARGIAQDTDQHAWDAEILRLTAEVAARNGEADEALKSARDGIRVAQETDGRLYELRAAMSFERIARENGSGQDGLRLLSEACSRLAADADFPLLHEARSRLTGQV